VQISERVLGTAFADQQLAPLHQELDVVRPLGDGSIERGERLVRRQVCVRSARRQQDREHEPP
jgi:hypothetical protein